MIENVKRGMRSAERRLSDEIQVGLLNAIRGNVRLIAKNRPRILRLLTSYFSDT